MSGQELFDRDPYPGAPRILFVGWAHSSHTHAWVDLLAGRAFNVRFFALPDHRPPEDWPVKTYLPLSGEGASAPETRHRRPLAFAGGVPGFSPDPLQDVSSHWPPSEVLALLAQTVRDFRPQVIHCLGLNPASYLYLDTRHRFGLEGIGKWVVQARGGPDLELNRLHPDHRERIRAVLLACDAFIADNEPNYQNARDLGLDPAKQAPFGVVPGTGGVDVKAVAGLRQGPPSRRERLVVWPKAYECPQSKALPIYEALCQARAALAPCRVLMLSSTPETRAWYLTLPEAVRQMCELAPRLPRTAVLELLGRARVMLAPSILDGVPNSLIEAMALGAFPIVSPLHTITPVVAEERNVLFARNLYPDEIATALIRAMRDDELVDAAAGRNLETVGSRWDRSLIASAVAAFYQDLADRSAASAL